MVGLLAGVGFVPTFQEFETLLKKGFLIPGLQYVIIDLEKKRHAKKEKFLKTLFYGACVKDHWYQGIYSDIKVKRAKIEGKLFVVVFPSEAEEEKGTKYKPTPLLSGSNYSLVPFLLELSAHTNNIKKRDAIEKKSINSLLSKHPNIETEGGKRALIHWSRLESGRKVCPACRIDRGLFVELKVIEEKTEGCLFLQCPQCGHGVVYMD